MTFQISAEIHVWREDSLACHFHSHTGYIHEDGLACSPLKPVRAGASSEIGQKYLADQ